ncbi:MAG: CpsD/CapB family tyrosine-protein kinase [Nitrospirota bacterium]
MMDINQALLEETLRIKVNILQMGAGNPIKSMIVTGANHGEGVSTVAANLAYAFALGDTSRVLLIDANARQPNLHVLFDLSCENGFLDVISSKIELTTGIKKTSFPNINVITAGQLLKNNSLTAFNAISQDIKKSIEKDFDWVIYDTAPINSSPETLMTVTLADSVILVILAEKTRWQSVKKAKESLESVGANILGAVLNSQKNYIPRVLYERF